MDQLTVGNRKKNKHTKSQPILLQMQGANNNLNVERNNDGLLNMSYISRIDETKESINNPNVNESREHYEQALVQLTTKAKLPQNRRNSIIDPSRGKSSFAASKTNMFNSKMVDSVKDMKKYKFDATNSCLNFPSMTSRSFNPHKSTFRRKTEKPLTENKTQVWSLHMHC